MKMAAIGSLSCCHFTPRCFSPCPLQIRGNEPKSTSMPSRGLCRSLHYHKSRFFVARAMNFTAGHSDDPVKAKVDDIASSLRRLTGNLPHPVKDFPWTKAVQNTYRLTIELVVAVGKYLCIPVLAISSLSEMSYCAHERKMIVIPIPFLVGFTVAGVLKETTQEVAQNVKEGGFPVHLLVIAAFFLLLKLSGPYYPYWGRLIIPHFANGGLWRTLWSAITWYRLSRQALGKTSTPTLSEHSPIKE